MAAQTTCTATDVAVTAVITDATDTAGRTALAADCTTLLGLMDTLRGTASLNWATTLSMASWDGIFVSGSRVVHLTLGSRQLNGTIPSALNSLTALIRLELRNNELSGQIPALSGLTSLQYLSLQRNELSGQIPALSGLTNLQRLDLQRNELSGQIPALSGLTSLQYLSLRGNELSGQIPALNGLTSLATIDLQVNQLSGEIPALNGLSSLEFLGLSNNKLSGAIPALSGLSSLQFLYLQRNQLSGAIPALSGLSSLQFLDLDNNQLSGEIPALSALTSLQFLDLQRNQLSGAIPALSGLSSLQFLYLNDNQLSGAIPALSALTSLQRLYLHNNQLSGAIPVTLGSLTSLQRLLLTANPLTGGIPMELGNLSSLTWLALCGTDLDASATLPSALETRRTGGQLTVWSCVRIEDATAPEGDPLSFPVTHSTYPVRGVAGATGGLTLTYATADGTATSADYTGTSTGSLTIPANTDPLTTSSSAPLSVPTIANSESEGAVTLTVTLSGWPTTGVFPLRRIATGTITEVVPEITISGGADITEGGSATFTITAHPVPTSPLTVNIGVTERGSFGATGAATASVRSAITTYTIATTNDNVDEPNGSVTATIQSGSGYTVGAASSASVSVADNDDPPPPPPPPPPPRRPGLSIGDARAFEGTPLTFAVTLSRRVGRTVTVEWTTRDGTARAGTDYTAGSGTLRFPAGTTRQTITVPTHDNTRDEASRTFTVILSRATGGVRLQDARGRGLIRDDDDPSPGRLEIPAFGTVQSGVRVLSGWICEARQVHIEFITPGQPVRRVEAAYGTERADTATECGDMDNGFGLLWNWNILGDGRHTVRVLVDGRVWMTRRVMVTTLGAEFRRELAGTYALADFPTAGETVTVEWQEAQQNFVLAAGEPPDDTEDTGADFPHAVFENPAPGSFQSGIGIVSGWICEAEEIEVEFLPEDGEPWREEAAYGTERVDTVEVERAGETIEVCGDTDNGFGLLVNWNRLGDGVHEVVVRADGAVLGRRTVRVTTLGAEFRRGLSGTYELADFPTAGETVTIAWREAQQNFVITDRQ